MIHWEDYREEGLPEILLSYRAVEHNPIADDPCPPLERSLVGIRNLFTDRNPEYWKQRTALETAYLEWRKAEAKPMTVLSDWKEGPCPTCKRLPQEALEGMSHDELMGLIKGLEVGNEK